MLSLLYQRPVVASSIPRTARGYVVSVKQPRIYEGKPTPRRYGVQKTFLYNQYTRMLAASDNSPIIFLQHTNFSVQRLQTLRRDIAAANTKFSVSLSSPTPAPVEAGAPSLSVMRTSLFGVALRDFAPLDTDKADQIAALVKGSLAVLTLPSFNPPQLDAILRALDRSVPPKKPNAEQAKPMKPQDDPNFIPGRKMQRVRPVLTPELVVMGALIEGRVFGMEGVRDVSKLPTLDTLRAQIVGLLSSPAVQLAAVLSEASGGKLARTLEGLKKGLEESRGAETSS
jgi:ribosomal protein L10